MALNDLKTCWCDNGYVKVWHGDGVVLPHSLRAAWEMEHSKGTIIERFTHKLACSGWHLVKCPDCSAKRRWGTPCRHAAQALRESRRGV